MSAPDEAVGVAALAMEQYTVQHHTTVLYNHQPSKEELHLQWPPHTHIVLPSGDVLTGPSTDKEWVLVRKGSMECMRGHWSQ